MTWWARTTQKSGSRLLPNAAVPVWLSSALRTSAMAPEKIWLPKHRVISSKLTRHITRRELIVREREVEGHHTVTKCDTSDNLADLLTKALDPIPFDKLRRLVLNILAVGAIYPVPRARRIATKAWRNV